MENKEELLEPIKFIRGSMSRRLPIDEEVRKARGTPAYWWFECLRASKKYKECCQNAGLGQLAETFNKFGDVFGYPHFDVWWKRHGRFLFIQSERKKVKLLEERDLRRLDMNMEKLILEVPLTLRKQTVMRQIGLLLKDAYLGREIDIQKNSSAQIKFEKSKIRMTTVETLLKLHKLRYRYPEMSLNEIGLRAGIELDLHARLTKLEDMDESEYEKVRRMTIAVSRYLKQARCLIANAEKGIFPSLKETI